MCEGAPVLDNQVCRLCGSDDKIVLFEKADISYFRCRNCDLVFSYPAENANFANAINDYEAAYVDYLTGSACDHKNHAKAVKWMGRFCSLQGKKVLDVGTGSGKFVRYLREEGIEAYGLEPARALYDRFLSDDPFFFCDGLEGFDEDVIGGKADVITAWDVIEHVEWPDAFFENIARVLKSGGMLFIDTPDAGSWPARLLGRRWHHYNKYHFSYFSRWTAGRLAARNGLREAGFTRLTYWKSLKYVTQYLNDFVLGGRPKWQAKSAREIALPLNIRDMMFAAYQKD